MCVRLDHLTRILIAHQHADIVITKVTHAGRVFAGSSTRSHGSSVDDTKALGGWNEHSGVFRSCYDRALPLPALLGAAMFNGRDPATYNLPRDVLGVFSCLFRCTWLTYSLQIPRFLLY